MTIFIRTSGGGGVVLLIGLALLASHGGGISAALAAVVIALVVAVVLAVLGLGGYLVYRARREVRPHFRQVVHQAPLVHEQSSALPATSLAALEPPAVRLHPDQLAELAEILRRPAVDDERR
jgi:hypothetical protein